MRVVLASSVIVHGEVRASGFVVDGDAEFCTQLVTRGLASPIVSAVDVIAESIVSPVDDLPAVSDPEPVRHAPKPSRHRSR